MGKAREIMMRDILTVQEDVPIYLAIGILIQRGISGLPVVDTDDHLVGIITEKDMLRLVNDETVAETQTVSDYMVREVKSFPQETDIDDIRNFLIARPFRRVPIVDEKGKVVGIISRRDIISYFLETRDGMNNFGGAGTVDDDNEGIGSGGDFFESVDNDEDENEGMA